MKIFKPTGLLLMTIAFATCSFGQLWKQYIDSARFFQKNKKIATAIEYSNKVREELKKDSIGTISYASSCINLSILYSIMRLSEKAELLYIEAKQTYENVLGKEHPNYANFCYSLAFLYKNMGQYKKSESLYLEAKRIQEKVFGKEHLNYANTCNNLALLYMDIGQYEKAKQLHLEAMKIREKVLGKEHLDYAESCNNLAIVYKRMGHFEQAESICQQARLIYEKALGKQDTRYANSCANLGNVYKDVGQYEKAEALLLEAKQIFEKVFGKQHPNYANSCDDLASLYNEMGQYEKAEALFLEAKQITEKVTGKEHPDYAASCNNLAALYQDMGQYKKAELLYLEAKQIWEKVLGQEHPDYATACDNLATLYYRMRQDKKALHLYIEAKQIREKVLGKEHPDYAASCNNLAALYKAIGQDETVELLYIEAKQTWEKVLGKEHPRYADGCTNLALHYLKMGQYKKTKPLFLEAKRIREKGLGKKHSAYANSCNNLAVFYWLQHQPLLAEKEFKESFLVNTYNLFSVFQFTTEKEKSAFIKNKSGEDDNAYSFYVSEKIKSEQPYSLSLFHRNLILSSSQALKKQISYANDTAITNKYNELRNLKQYLAVLYSKPIDERQDAAEVEEKADKLEKELTRLSSPFAKQQQRKDWQKIKSILKTNEAAIEFASFHFNNGKRYTDTVLYIASVVRKDKSLPVTIALFNEKQLTALLLATGDKIGNDGVEKLYASRGVTVSSKSNSITNKSIYDLVWKPLEKELKGTKTAYFAPAGMLHRIAFAALPVNKTEVLSDRYKLVQLATTASVTDQQDYVVSPSDKIQLYGGISYNVDTTAFKSEVLSYHKEKAINRSLPADLKRGEIWDNLPGTKAEINGIESLSDLYKTNIASHSGIDATEESLKALDGKASPAVLHIATHGFFFPDPKEEKNNQRDFESGKVFKQSDDPLMRSGLLFAGANAAWQNKPIDGIDDGILTAYEVSNLYLPNTKLVVLSACETGLGDIQGSEGVYGLQRAFKMAGAQNLVMSLWKVPDVETAEFMQQFYKNLFAKQTISDAFYNAQGVMKNKYRKEPYKWAAWVLVR